MKVWKEVAASDGAGTVLLAERLGVSRAFAGVLASRGFGDPRAADSFLHPRLSSLSDPFLLPGMERAADRTWDAIEKGERIAVFGDYDADGIVSAAVLTQTLRALGATVEAILPNRLEEGYGLSLSGLRRCIESAAPALLITADCGSNDAEAIRAAAAQGIAVVVTDHHEISGSAAAPFAHVNPKLDQGSPETRDLAGAGVAFKFCHAICKHGRARGSESAGRLDLKEYLDLIALATVADVVPLLGENRILASHGIRKMKDTKHPGLRALMDVARMPSEVDAYHLGFVLGPRLNATGRLGDAEQALALLLETDETRAREIACRLDEANVARRSVEREIFEEARSELDGTFRPEEHYGIAVGRKGWHPGVIGVVASRLSAAYNRPAIVVAFDASGKGRGSGRSIPGFDLVAGLKECGAALESFGGHRQAAGLTVDSAKFDVFRKQFGETCAKALRGCDLRPVQRIDGWISLSEAETRLADDLDMMKPFGEGNPEPVWAVSGVTVIGRPRVLKEAHLRMSVASGASEMGGIGFGMGKRRVPEGPLDIAFVLRRDRYRGRGAVEMEIKDFRQCASRTP